MEFGYLLYIEKPFYFKIFQHNAKAGLLRPHLAHFCEKKPFDVIYYLYKMKQIIPLVTVRSKELSSVEENHATVIPGSSVASRETKTYSESRIELRNLQNLKKMLEKEGQC